MKHNLKTRLLSLLLCVSMMVSLLAHVTPVKSAEGDAEGEEKKTTISNLTAPFRPDVEFVINGETLKSQSYRIPTMVTLDDGTIVAAADIRWNTTYDGGGLDTLVARSTDGGKTWKYTVANYLGDNKNQYNALSSTFIDPNLLVGADGHTVYMLVDLYAYGVALNGNGQQSFPTSDTGFNADGYLALSSNKRASFDYYLKDGKIWTNGATDPLEGYSVDAYFNITGPNGEKGNLFCADSPFQVAKTQFLYLIKSTDGGATWSEPSLLNLRKPAGTTPKDTDEDALLVAPAGSVTTSKGVMVFPVYSYAHYTTYNSLTASYQHMGLIYSTDGVNWERTEDFTELDFSSEGSVIELQNGNLRVFFRNDQSRLCYADYDLEAKKWLPYVKTEIRTNSNTQLSAITYSRTSDGKQVVLVSCPSGPTNKDGINDGNGSWRTNGKIHVFIVNEDGSMTEKKAIDQFTTPATGQLSDPNYLEEQGFFAYSALTEGGDGSILLMYENNQFGWGAGTDNSIYFTITIKGYTADALGIKLDDPENIIVDANGNRIDSFTMGQFEKPEITAQSPFNSADVKYQWQIEYEDGKWVDIYGETSKTVKISYGMVATLLSDDGKVNIRCKSQSGTSVAYSKPITVTIEMYQPEEPDVVVSESLTTSSGEVVTVTVAGSIPKDASVQLEEAEPDGVDVGASETVVASLDISIKNADGTEWQPESGETVMVTLEASKIGLKDGDEFVVYHLHDGEVKILGAYTVKDDTVSFEVDGFSLFVFALAAEEVEVETPDYSGDEKKHASVIQSENVFVSVLEVEPTLDNAYNPMIFEYVDFADVVLQIDSYKVVTEIYDVTDEITGEIIGQAVTQGLWYQVSVVSGTAPEDFANGYWIFQNYITEGDAYDTDTLVLFDATVDPEIPAEPELNITVDGVDATEITVSTADKVTLTATPNVEGTATYQWQLLIPSADMWVNISGQTSAECIVNYGMVANRLDADSKAHIRCVTTVNGTEIISEAIAVKIAEAAPVSSVSSSSMARRNVMLSAEDTTLYNIVINYVFEDGTVAATPFTSKIGVTGSLTSTVEFPDVQGYLPYVNDVEQDSYTFNLHGSEMAKDFVMTVVYKPTLVNYTVVVMHQNVHNDNYSEYERKTLQALTGTVIDSDEEVEVVYPGFYQLLHKQVTIAADGSTVIEVRYDRYYYLMTFDLGEGGYGVLPVYARYGTEIEVEDPTRPGYVYEHWIDPAGNVVTFPMSMPAHDIEITAVWTPSNAKYTIVYWKENADPNADGTYGYSYWGSRIVTTLAGNVVSGSDDIPTSITSATVDGETINEKKYFTYNETLTDKNIVVKGDGSTIVNVYYTRNTYTLYFYGYGKCCLTEHTHGTGCNSKLICTLEEHTHTDCNRTLNCDIPEHNAHTDECLICGKEEHTVHTTACLQCTHMHDISCWTINGGYLREVRETTKPDEIDEDSYVSGTIYTFTTKSGNWETTHRYLYLNGKWYCGYSGYYERYDDTYIISPNCSHTTHTTACYKDEIHTHSVACYKDVIHAHNESCYKYSCGKITHTHTADCYSDCTIPAHTHGNNCNSDSTSNAVAVVVDKYEADISDQWPTYDKLAAGVYHYKDSNGNVENASGQRFRGWSLAGSNTTSTSMRFNMTAEICDAAMSTTKTTAKYDYDYYVHLYYMFESFDQSETEESDTRKKYNGVWYDSETSYYQNVYSGSNDFSQKEIIGMNPAGTQSERVGGYGSVEYNNWLYYTRNRSDLTYQSIDTVVDTKTDIMFGESLKNYQYTGTPPYPSSLEKGAYEFGGWYTTAGCFDGTEVNFDTAKMPNGDMILYAKWEPVTHTVQFYRLKDDGGNLIDKIGDTYEVKHNQKLNEQYIPEAPEDFKNGAYSFAGWWYMDGTTERRFDFKSLPVTEDLVVYAKWTSNKQIQYNIHFKLADGTPVADSISSSDLAGTTITVDAKGGEELYPAYREGYFPNVKSHSLTLDIDAVDGVMEFSFVYTPATAVPYTVYYVAKTLKEGGTSLGTITIDEITYYIIADTEVKNDNRLAYVSENFKPVPGYVSDEFQKNLVIVPGEENVIVFYYTVDTENAPYKVTHYIQNLDGQTWTVEYSYSGIAKINSTYTENPMTIVGFTYDSTKSNASGVVTANGLELQLYYTRNKYPYKVVYKEQSTGNVLYTSNIENEYYGKVVAKSAQNIYENYTRVSEATKSITIRIEEDLDNPAVNVITFFYEETQVRLNYVIVDPDGNQFTVNQAWGELTSFGESVKISTGKANGSNVIVNSSIYKFVGWYENAACTAKIGDDETYVPAKADGALWVDGTTYYAKFEYNLTSLTIVKVGAEAYKDIDPNQTFIFNISGNGIDLDVTVHRDTGGNWSTTIDGLTVGATYTVTEKTDWSWRYKFSKWEHKKNSSDTAVTEGTTNGAKITLGLDGTITFTNTRNEDQWLDGDSYKVNIFGGNN